MSINFDGLFKSMKQKEELETITKAAVFIKTSKDEKEFKKFLSYYFPNHYARGMLKKNLIDKLIAISVDGFGSITAKLAYYGNYKFINTFNEFQDTKCYKEIIEKGINFEVGEVEVISLEIK